MPEYMLNGEPIQVAPEHVALFEAENPNSELVDKASEKIARDILPTLGKLTDSPTGTQATESNVMGSDLVSGFSESVQDRITQPNVVIPEIDPDAPLSSEDFYSILKEDKKEEKEKEVKEKDLYSVTKTGDEVTHKIPKLDLDADTPVARDEDLLKAWLNNEYFGKGIAENGMDGHKTLSGYFESNPNKKSLIEDFHSNLGDLGISRSAYPNLSDSDLDHVFEEVFDARRRKEVNDEQTADQYIKINDILSAPRPKDQTDGDAIIQAVDSLDWGMINSAKNLNEAKYAKLTKLLKTDLDAETRALYEKAIDPDIPGSIGDLVFNKDETEYDMVSRMMVPTGKRIPKEKEHQLFHHLETGENVRVGERKAIEKTGGTTVDITDAYQLYLTQFGKTSLDDLTKFNSQHLLEKSGYNIEGEQTGDYYIGDKMIRRALTDMGYEQEDFVFKNVKLKDIMMQSHRTHGALSFFRRDDFMSKGDIIPQDFEGKPYENEKQFLDYLRVRRNQGNDIAAKDAALWEMYYLNRDPSTLTLNRGSQFAGSYVEQLLGKQFTQENLPTWNKKILDTFDSQIRYESGVDIAEKEVDKKTGLVIEEQQADIFERTLTDDFIEGGAGISAILTVMHPINKVDKALKITQGILGKSRYVNMTGKNISQAEAIRRTAKYNRAIVKTGRPSKSVTDWAKDAGYVEKQISSLRKGLGIAGFGMYEDFKLKEVLGAVTDGRMEFKRGVGAGFAMGPRLLPYGFGKFARGKAFDLTVARKSNYAIPINSFLQSTLMNGPAFAMAVESGDVLGAAVDHYGGGTRFKTWADHHWGDRDENMKRIGMNIFWGKALGMKNFDYRNKVLTQDIKEFNTESIMLYGKDRVKIIEKAEKAGITEDQWVLENPNHELVKSRDKHLGDHLMAQQRLDMINKTQKWTGSAAEVGDTYVEHYEPLIKMFKDKGKDIRIIVTDAPIYQKMGWDANGKEITQEVDALYTKMADAKDGVATIQINSKRSKGRETANHESIHAYLDLMGIKLKKQVAESFKKALESIKTPGGNLWKDILETSDIRGEDKIEEMLAYGIQYMSRVENYNSLTSNKAWSKISKFWNNFAESTLGKKADLNLKQDILDLMGTIAETGRIDKIELLNEMIDYDPVMEGPEFGIMARDVASKEINKNIKQIEDFKAKIEVEINDLKAVGPGYEDLIEEKTKVLEELNSNQRKLENKAELDAVDVAKDTSIKSQIDKNYTIGKYKDIKVGDKTIPAKQVFQDQQKNAGKRAVAEDIRTSTGLEHIIRETANANNIIGEAQNKFVLDSKNRMIEKFLIEYDPGVINKEYGRELTPFEWLSTGLKSKRGIIYWAMGDIMNKYKKEISTISVDATEGGWSTIEGYTEQTGHMNTAKTFDSKVEREGIELSEQPAMRKKVGDKTLGEIIDQKSGADAKNLDFEAKKAKEIVSYKNIQSNAERTIGKEVAVDHYGMSLEMHKKTLKDKSQWLNNDDITNILDVIKSDVEADLNMMPRWKQSIIDKYTGKEVAFDIVGGKFPSEPKATGTTTSVLKLTDASGKPLIYEPIPQTGTKGTKYKFTKRYEEWLEITDPVVKKQFEQDVVDALSRGTKSEISGKLKGWIMQRKKAMYVQGVDKALPNTPELTLRHTLAEMSNQVTAGKNPKLASKELNKIIKQLTSDLNKNLALGKPHTYKEMMGFVKSDKYKNKFSKEELKAVENDLEAMKERLVSKQEQEAIKAKEEMTVANAKEYVNNVDFKSGEMEVSMEILSDQLGFKVTAEHLQQAANNTIQKSRFTGKKDGKPIINRENLEGFREIAGEYFKQFSKDFGITFAKHMIGDPLSGRKNGWYEVIDGKLVKVKNTDPILDLNSIYNANVGKSVNPAFEGLTTKYTKGSKIAKAFQKARELAEKGDMEGAKEVMESVLSKSDQKTKQDLYQALGKAQEAVILNSKNIKDYIKRATFVFDVAKNNSSATEGERILTTTVGVRLKKGEGTGLKNPIVKELIKEGMKVEDALKKDLPKVEHVKSSLEASFDKAFSVNQLKWSFEGTSLAKKYLGVISSVGRLDKIDVAGLKTNPAGLSRMALIRSDLKNNLEFKDGKFTNKTLEDVLMVDAATKLQSLGVKVKSGELKQDYMFEAVNKFLIESSPGMAEVVSQTVKNKKNIKRLNEINKKKLKNLGFKDVASKDINKVIKIVDKALENGRNRNKKSRGASVFDFDETVGISENFVIATKGGKTKKIASDKWPVVGEKMVNEGWKMDFSDFNKVTKGKPGPLMQKMKNQIKKYGPDNVFILTARAKESAPAIHEWLKTQGVNIPLKNITGLGKSTGEAKAMWMLEKFAEGYNDMYFVDDAISNVKAVRDVLNQLDIKSKVQQALASTNINKNINKIIEHSLDISSEKVFSKAEAKVRGKDIKRRRIFMRDSAADLELLIEPLYGKGKEGIENKKWFKETLVMPFERGIRDYNTARQSAKNDYMALRRQNKDVVKEISKEVEGTTFTNDMAMRVYLWNKAGYKIPDLAKRTEIKLVEHIKNNPKLQAYAEQFAKITKQEKGLKEPGQQWWAETMAGEVTNVNRGVSRKQYLQEWIDIKNEIFTEANLNKMESKLGTEWRENIEDMFDRMETGRTRSLKMDRGSAMMMNYLNGSIGSIMNFNTRSAALQTISTLNFLNMRENNPIAAARAMADIKQFSKDFVYIMNSDMLKQRRDGLAMNVTEAEIASAAVGSKNPIQSIIAKVLKYGYLPTKMADSFAISFGGATFYRNRIKMYEKQGMKTKEAENQAWLDFQVLSERTQQSSRADLLSKQQTSLIGRFILPFANTPMQMNRAGMKDILDISKGRYKGGKELSEKMGRITYYMGAQIAIFAGLQSAMFALMLNEDDVPEKTVERAKTYAVGSTTDSFLRGFGVRGAVLSALKNATIEYAKQSKKPGFTADYTEVGEALLNISPPIGSKFGKLDRAGDMMKWAKIRKEDEFKFELGNPSLQAALLTIEAITNAPLHGWHQNAFNIQHALSDDYEMWQRAHMLGGWTPYQLGIEDDKKEKKKKPKEKVPYRRGSYERGSYERGTYSR